MQKIELRDIKETGQNITFSRSLSGKTSCHINSRVLCISGCPSDWNIREKVSEKIKNIWKDGSDNTLYNDILLVDIDIQFIGMLFIF